MEPPVKDDIMENVMLTQLFVSMIKSVVHFQEGKKATFCVQIMTACIGLVGEMFILWWHLLPTACASQFVKSNRCLFRSLDLDSPSYPDVIRSQKLRLNQPWLVFG